MKRSSGSAAQPADFASDRSTEQPADQTADDNSKRRKCDEQAKSASDAHPGHIDLIWATSTWHRRQLMKCIEEQCLELGIEMESLFEAAAERRRLVLRRLERYQFLLHRLHGSAVQPVVDTTHEIAERDMREMYHHWRWDVDSWMDEDDVTMYRHLTEAGLMQARWAHQFSKKAFSVYLFHLAGSKFLLHKLIQLPILTQRSAEQPASAQLPACLMKCINDLQEHKKTPKYKAAVGHSRIRQLYRCGGM